MVTKVSGTGICWFSETGGEPKILGFFNSFSGSSQQMNCLVLVSPWLSRTVISRDTGEASKFLDWNICSGWKISAYFSQNIPISQQ